MVKFKRNNKGIVLVVVLATFFIVLIFATIVLNIMSSHSRLTHHQVSRIQSYYADKAAINYAYEKLRLGTDPAWPVPAAGNHYEMSFCASGCTVTEANFPGSIQYVLVRVARKDVTNKCAASNYTFMGTTVNFPESTPPAGIDVCVNAASIYTYTP